MKQLYDILGVDKHASPSEIKAAYRQKAKLLHPDADTGDEEKFMELQKAYDILMDGERRKIYDETGSAGPDTVIDQIPQQAMEFLIFCIHQIIDDEKIDIVNHDFCGMLKKLIEVAIESDIGLKKIVEKKLERVKTVAARMGVKDGGENKIGRALDYSASQLQVMIDNYETRLKAKRHGAEIAEQYEYNFDRIQQIGFGEWNPETESQGPVPGYYQRQPKQGEWGFFRKGKG